MNVMYFLCWKEQKPNYIMMTTITLLLWSCKFVSIYNFSGRHRWVEYAVKDRYNASQVPAEWHGWLHHITDNTGDQASLPLHVFFVLNS